MKVLSNIQNNEDAVTKEYVDAKTGISAVDPTSGSIETELIIPTKTSQLTNDSGFITSAAVSGKEDTSNKTTSITSSSTNTQYPSAKAVYDLFTSITNGDEVSY